MASKFCDNAIRLEPEVAAKVKGMLQRGDDLEDIAVWFGISLRVVQSIQAGAVQQEINPAPIFALPPRGPYDRAKAGYGALKAVDAAEHHLHEVADVVRRAYRR